MEYKKKVTAQFICYVDEKADDEQIREWLMFVGGFSPEISFNNPLKNDSLEGHELKII